MLTKIQNCIETRKLFPNYSLFLDYKECNEHIIVAMLSICHKNMPKLPSMDMAGPENLKPRITFIPLLPATHLNWKNLKKTNKYDL